MGKGLNKVCLIGRLGRDVELKHTEQGTAVVTLSVGTTDSWTDQHGNRHEKTDWHRVSLYAQVAEIAARHLKKGSRVYLEGKLQTRKWQDAQGQDRYTTEVYLRGAGAQLLMLDAPTHREEVYHPAMAQPKSLADAQGNQASLGWSRHMPPAGQPHLRWQKSAD